MKTILLITSSLRGEASHSTRVATDLARRLRDANPGSRLVVRDLAGEPLPHIDADFASGIATAEADRSPAQRRAVALSDQVVDELLEADHVVIATGVYNFNIASTLKAWFDHAARAGRTFRYTENGPQGLAGDRAVYAVVASGGVYSEGPGAAIDHAVTYLRHMLGFLGMTRVEIVRVEGVAMGPDAERKAVDRAADRVSELAAAA